MEFWRAEFNESRTQGRRDETKINQRERLRCDILPPPRIGITLAFTCRILRCLKSEEE
jgi:hypothetical protein